MNPSFFISKNPYYVSSVTLIQWRCSKQQEVKYRWHALEILCRHFVFSIKICKWAGRRYQGQSMLDWSPSLVPAEDYWSHPTFHASSVLQRNSKTTLLGILNLSPREFSGDSHKIHKSCLILEWPKEQFLILCKSKCKHAHQVFVCDDINQF